MAVHMKAVFAARPLLRPYAVAVAIDFILVDYPVSKISSCNMVLQGLRLWFACFLTWAVLCHLRQCAQLIQHTAQGPQVTLEGVWLVGAHFRCPAVQHTKTQSSMAEYNELQHESSHWQLLAHP
jgi:hypothetical protein